MTAAAGGGGFGGGDFDIKPYALPGSSADAASMQYQQIMDILHGLKPGDVAAAGDAFGHMGDVMDAVAGNLANTGERLAASGWRGKSAQAAMSKLQQLHDQAAQFAAQARTAAKVTQWVGQDVLPKYQSLPDPQVMSKTEQDAAIGSVLGPLGSVGGAGLGALGIGRDGSAKADQAARQYISSLDQHLADAHKAMPSSLSGPNQVSYGQGSPGAPSGGAGSGAAPGSAGRGSGAGGPLPGYGSGSSPAGSPNGETSAPAVTHHVNSSGLPSGGAGEPPAGNLAGYTPPSSGSGFPASAGTGIPGGLPGAGGGTFSPAGMMPGGGFGADAFGAENGFGTPGTGRGLDPAGESIPGEDTASMADESTAASAAEEVGAAEAAGTEAGGMGMMPMAGGAGGGDQEKERQRQAWMSEDEDVWRVPQDSIEPVIE